LCGLHFRQASPLGGSGFTPPGMTLSAVLASYGQLSPLATPSVGNLDAFQLQLGRALPAEEAPPLPPPRQAPRCGASNTFCLSSGERNGGQVQHGSTLRGAADSGLPLWAGQCVTGGGHGSSDVDVGAPNASLPSADECCGFSDATTNSAAVNDRR